MPAKFKLKSITQRTSIGTQAYTGFGFQPTGVFGFGNNRTADGSHTDAVLAAGASDGAGRDIFIIAPDNVSPSNVAWKRFSRLWNISTVTLTDLVQADIQSFDPDGFTLLFQSADAIVRLFMVLAFSGVNFDVGTFQAPASPGPVSVSTLTFAPSYVLFLSSGLTTAAPSDSANGDSPGFIGFSAGPGKDRCCHWRIRDNRTPSDSARVWFNDACIAYMGTPNEGATTPGVKAVMQALKSNGFTVNFSATLGTHHFAWVAIGGETYAKVGTLQQPSGIGVQAITGLGFKPGALILVSANTNNASGVNTSKASISLGAASGPTERACCWFGDDGQSPSVADSDLDQTKVIKLIEPNSLVVNGAADLASFDSDGFTLNWTATDGVARHVSYIVLATQSAPAALQHPSQSAKQIKKTRRLRYRPTPTKSTALNRTNNAGDVVNTLIIDPEA